MKTMEIQKDFFFDAAHSLPNVNPNHKCRATHGHSFKVIISVEGEIDERYGWVMDFGELSKIVQPVINELDHKYLNEIKGLENPTSENIALFFWTRLKPLLPLLKCIEIRESDTARCIYKG